MARTEPAGECLCLMLGIECWCTRPGPGGFSYRPHGTPAAERRHYRRGEPLCRACKQSQERGNADRTRQTQDQREHAREQRERQLEQVRIERAAAERAAREQRQLERERHRRARERERLEAARAIREMREQAGMTRPAFADALGVSLHTARSWERAKYRPPPGMLARVAEVTGWQDGAAGWDVAA